MNYQKSAISKYEPAISGGSGYPLTEFITSASYNFEKTDNASAIYGGGHKDSLDRMKKYSIPMCLVYDALKGDSTTYVSKTECGVLSDDMFDKLFSPLKIE